MTSTSASLRTPCLRRVVRWTLLCGLAACAVALPVGSRVHAADPVPADRFPEPSLYPVSWEFKFRHGTPKRVIVRVPGDERPMAYWYLTYTVMNLGDKAQTFEPDIEMVADDSKTYHADRAIPLEVFDEIKKHEGNSLLVSSRKVSGVLNAGEEQARDGVAIWPEPVLRMGTFSIFVAGLSGEMLTLKKVGDKFVPVDPKKAAEELKDVKEEDRLVLRKQLQLTYKVYGDDIQPGNDPIEKKTEKWILR